MELVSNLEEFKAESYTHWTVNNITNIDWKKGYVIKSKEIFFKEANAFWHVKLLPIFCSHGTFLTSKFYLRDKNDDQNARYVFDIALKDGNSDGKTYLKEGRLNPKTSLIECQMTNFTKISNLDTIKLIPRVTFETLRCELELPKGKIGNDESKEKETLTEYKLATKDEQNTKEFVESLEKNAPIDNLSIVKFRDDSSVDDFDYLPDVENILKSSCEYD